MNMVHYGESLLLTNRVPLYTLDEHLYLVARAYGEYYQTAKTHHGTFLQVGDGAHTFFWTDP